MKAAVIGAAGFLGGFLCRQLRRDGWDVVGYDLEKPAAADADEYVEPLDVIGQELTFPEETEAVYYLAQSPHYRRFPERADHLFGVNTYGAVKAARAACACGARFFCYASTGNVYCPSLEPLAESSPVRRDDPYALSKVAAEEALQLFQDRMTVNSVRLFGLLGPGQEKMLPFVLLRKVQAGEPITLEPAPGSSGEPQGLTISFSYVEDTARCLEQLGRLALSGKSLPAVLNVGGPEPISLRRFAVTLGPIIGAEPKFECAATTRSFDLIADLSRLRALIDPVFTPFAEAMSRTYGGVAADSTSESLPATSADRQTVVNQEAQ